MMQVKNAPRYPRDGPRKNVRPCVQTTASVHKHRVRSVRLIVETALQCVLGTDSHCRFTIGRGGIDTTHMYN